MAANSAPLTSDAGGAGGADCSVAVGGWLRLRFAAAAVAVFDEPSIALGRSGRAW